MTAGPAARASSSPVGGGPAACSPARRADGLAGPRRPASGLRGRSPRCRAFDAILRNDRPRRRHASRGRPPRRRTAGSKVLGQWLAAPGATSSRSAAPAYRPRPPLTAFTFDADARCAASPASCGGFGARRGGRSVAAASCRRGGDRGGARREAPLTEPAVARPSPSPARRRRLVVASSMPIRDLEWFGGAARPAAPRQPGRQRDRRRRRRPRSASRSATATVGRAARRHRVRPRLVVARRPRPPRTPTCGSSSSTTTAAASSRSCPQATCARPRPLRAAVRHAARHRHRRARRRPRPRRRAPSPTADELASARRARARR